MTRLTLIPLALTLLLPACVAELGDPDDPELAEAESELSSDGLGFSIGYGEGYLSPVPTTRYGVADGMVGWVTSNSIQIFPGVYYEVPVTTTKNSGTNDTRWGYLHLKYKGTAPRTGTCALSSPAILVKGSTHVEGENPFPYLDSYDSSAGSTLVARAYVNGAFSYYQYWNIASDMTKSEVRTKSFSKSAYLQSGPTFYATAGAKIELDIKLENHAWANSEGASSVAITQFGFLATSSANLVSISCY